MNFVSCTVWRSTVADIRRVNMRSCPSSVRGFRARSFRTSSWLVCNLTWLLWIQSCLQCSSSASLIAGTTWVSLRCLIHTQSPPYSSLFCSVGVCSNKFFKERLLPFCIRIENLFRTLKQRAVSVHVADFKYVVVVYGLVSRSVTKFVVAF